MATILAVSFLSGSILGIGFGVLAFLDYSFKDGLLWFLGCQLGVPLIIMIFLLLISFWFTVFGVH